MSRAREIAGRTLNSADINGGTIDGTTIGGVTSAAGSFTTINSTSTATLGGNLVIPDDGTIGSVSDTDAITIDSSGNFIFNENGNDSDFRVESNNNTHALFVDGASGAVNMSTSSTLQNTTSGKGWTWTGSYMVSAGENDVSAIFRRNGTSGALLQFRYDTASGVGSIDVSSSGTTYNTTSDRRLKENIETITDGIDKLMAMNPVTHTWKADPDAPAVHGFIAQEMQEIAPESVSGDPDDEEMMSMDYGRITPILVAALQDAVRKIESLEAEIATFKGDK